MKYISPAAAYYLSLMDCDISSYTYYYRDKAYLSLGEAEAAMWSFGKGNEYLSQKEGVVNEKTDEMVYHNYVSAWDTFPVGSPYYYDMSAG